MVQREISQEWRTGTRGSEKGLLPVLPGAGPKSPKKQPPGKRLLCGDFGFWELLGLLFMALGPRASCRVGKRSAPGLPAAPNSVILMLEESSFKSDHIFLILMFPNFIVLHLILTITIFNYFTVESSSSKFQYYKYCQAGTSLQTHNSLLPDYWLQVYPKAAAYWGQRNVANPALYITK